MMYNFGYGGFSPFMVFGFIFMILFWGLLIFGIIYFIKWAATSHDNSNKNNDHQVDKVDSRAMEILKERYAKGEIHKDQFEQMKKDLKD